MSVYTAVLGGEKYRIVKCKECKGTGVKHGIHLEPGTQGERPFTKSCHWCAGKGYRAFTIAPGTVVIE